MARALASEADLRALLLSARLPVEGDHVDAEAVGHARCVASNKAGFGSSALGGSYATACIETVLSFTRTLLEVPRNGEGGSVEDTSIAQTVEVPTDFGQEMCNITEDALSWCEGVPIVFRGNASSDYFCLGALPNDGFLSGTATFAALTDRLMSEPMPMIIVCHGATRGGGMLWPCVGTAVLAHVDATFGFPEIRRGVLPGVVSVVALRRLDKATTSRLLCTGEVINAITAAKLGLVDFLGSWIEVEASVLRLTELIHVTLRADPPGYARCDHPTVSNWSMAMTFTLFSSSLTNVCAPSRLTLHQVHRRRSSA